MGRFSGWGKAGSKEPAANRVVAGPGSFSGPTTHLRVGALPPVSGREQDASRVATQVEPVVAGFEPVVPGFEPVVPG
jgi:hypothetical protein